MVQLPEDLDLVLQGLGVLDHLLGDKLDDAVGVGRLLESGLVDDPVGSSAKDLSESRDTLGLNS